VSKRHGTWNGLKQRRWTRRKYRSVDSVAHTEWLGDQKIGTFGPAAPALRVDPRTGAKYNLPTTAAQRVWDSYPPKRQRVPAGPPEICIVVGADCPWNTTPGVRQVHQFTTIFEARNAGFNIPLFSRGGRDRDR
jgi:hypothetical protein